jgi:hypothetical protein
VFSTLAALGTGPTSGARAWSVPATDRTAYAHTLWNIDCTVTLMAEAVVKGGVFPRNGYRNIEWAVDLVGSRLGDMHAAFLWIKQDEMLNDLSDFLGGERSQADLSLRAVR